jgi:aminoglycoside 6-adenylyltransferase
MLEIPVRTMFLKIIEWYIGITTEFTVSFGNGGRNMKHHISPDLYNRILSTYPDSDVNNIWNSLFLMTEIFSQLARKISQAMNFRYNKDEELNMTDYLKQIHAMTTEK